MLKKMDQNALGPFYVENKIILITIIFIFFTSDEKERNPILMPTSFKCTLTFEAIIIIISTFFLVSEQSHDVFGKIVIFHYIFHQNSSF